MRKVTHQHFPFAFSCKMKRDRTRPLVPNENYFEVFVADILISTKTIIAVVQPIGDYHMPFVKVFLPSVVRLGDLRIDQGR